MIEDVLLDRAYDTADLDCAMQVESYFSLSTLRSLASKVG